MVSLLVSGMGHFFLYTVYVSSRTKLAFLTFGGHEVLH